MTRVAVVTGANKGIGFAIVAGLCRDFDGDVYLTSRDVSRGEDAVAKLEEKGHHPKFHQLDITDINSLRALRQNLEQLYGGVDVLINNAGVGFGYGDVIPPPMEVCEKTISINFGGAVNVWNELSPILKPGARVVNLSSMGFRRALGRCSTVLQNKLKACTTIDEVGRYMQDFVSAAKEDTLEAAGWPAVMDNEPLRTMSSTSYGISKMGVSIITEIQQKLMDKHRENDDIVINSCCPGRVVTGMSGWKGDKTPEEGAASLIHLALLPANIFSPRGEFMREIEIMPWK